MVKILDSGVQAENRLRPVPPPESLSLSFLTSYGTVRLLDDSGAARRGDHLLVIDVRQVRDVPDRGSVTPQLIDADRLWDIRFARESGQDDLRGFGVTVSVEQESEHDAVLVDGPPEPVANSTDGRADLIQMPPRTPPGFSVAQVCCEQRAECETPFAKGFVADLNAALVPHFLNIPVTEWEAMVQPNGVLDDGHRESVAVGLGVGHGGSASPELVKATQPFQGVLNPNDVLVVVDRLTG